LAPLSEQMTILGSMEMSLDDFNNPSKLQSLFSVVADQLNEQAAAIRLLRERDALLGKFCNQMVAALQVFTGNGSGREKLEERLSSPEAVTTPEAGFAEVEARAQALARELSRAALLVEQTVTSLEMTTDCAKGREMETQDATAEQSVASAEKFATQALQRVEARSEGTEQKLQQVQAQVELHIGQCSAGDGPGPPLEEEGKEEQEDLVTAAPMATMTSVEPTCPIGLLFPGQGSQYVKMMTSVKDLPAVNAMLQQAHVILGWDVLELCLTGPASRLAETQFSQPAMFIAGLAGIEKLRQDRREAAERFQLAAGLSGGEYTALCAAGVFSFEDGLKLVDIRGKALQEAGHMRKQAMLSVAGLDKPLLSDLCRKARTADGPTGVCQIANELFPAGFTCAGTSGAISALELLSVRAGAMYTKMLDTTCAFQTPLMAPARKIVAKALDEMLPRMNPPRHTVYMTTTAAPIKPGTSPSKIVWLLKRDLTRPELWDPSIRAMIKSGVTEFYEVGPMKQLKAIMKRIDSKAWGTTTNVEI